MSANRYRVRVVNPGFPPFVEEIEARDAEAAERIALHECGARHGTLARGAVAYARLVAPAAPPSPAS